MKSKEKKIEKYYEKIVEQLCEKMKLELCTAIIMIYKLLFCSNFVCFFN